MAGEILSINTAERDADSFSFVVNKLPLPRFRLVHQTHF